jgi:SagB-type dehydrogenase family enzyme
VVKQASDRQLIVIGSSVYVFSSDVHRVWRLPKAETPAWLPTYFALRQQRLSPTRIKKKIRESYDVSVAELGQCLDQLERAEVFGAELDDEQRQLPLPETWQRYGWEAAWAYHKSMFNSKFLDYSAQGAREDLDSMKAFLDREPMPSPFKDAPDHAERVPLRDLLNGEPDADERTTTAPRESIDLDQLSALVNLTFGQIAQPQPKSLRHEPLLKKTSPSGGARHPTEAYVFVFDVEGVAPGLYHFQVRTNELRLLRAGDTLADFRAFAIRDRDQPHFAPRFGVVLTSVVDRSMFRYRGSRSYRVLHYDVGHLLRTFDMVASSQGLETYTNYGIDEANLEHLLGLAACEEVPLAATMVGLK